MACVEAQRGGWSTGAQGWPADYPTDWQIAHWSYELKLAHQGLTAKYNLVPPIAKAFQHCQRRPPNLKGGTGCFPDVPSCTDVSSSRVSNRIACTGL